MLEHQLGDVLLLLFVQVGSDLDEQRQIGELFVGALEGGQLSEQFVELPLILQIAQARCVRTGDVDHKVGRQVLELLQALHVVVDRVLGTLVFAQIDADHVVLGEVLLLRDVGLCRFVADRIEAVPADRRKVRISIGFDRPALGTMQQAKCTHRFIMD